MLQLYVIVAIVYTSTLPSIPYGSRARNTFISRVPFLPVHLSYIGAVVWLIFSTSLFCPRHRAYVQEFQSIQSVEKLLSSRSEITVGHGYQLVYFIPYYFNILLPHRDNKSTCSEKNQFLDRCSRQAWRKTEGLKRYSCYDFKSRFVKNMFYKYL